MYANGGIQLLLGHAHPDCDSIPLHNFSSMRPGIVKAQYFICLFMDDCLCIDIHLAIGSIFVVLIKDAFFERSIFNVIDTDVISSEAMDGLFLAQSAATILQRGKYCGWVVVDTNVSFMRFKLGLPKEFSNSPTQVPPHFGGSARKFRQTLDNVTQGIDMIDACPINLIVSGQDLFAFCHFHPSSFKV